MKSMLKTLKRTIRNKNIAIPLYVTAGTSALLLLRRFVGTHKNGDHEKFREASPQFDNRQMGSIVAETEKTDQERSFPSSALKEEQSKTKRRREKIIQQLDEPGEETIIPESTLINTIDELSAPAEENKAQCRAITKKGTRCKNKADNSGYCFHHKNMEVENK